MRDLIKLATVAIFTISASTMASATVLSEGSALKPVEVVYGQEECKEGKKYNEETKKCEKKEG